MLNYADGAAIPQNDVGDSSQLALAHQTAR
jgi:hypothetical protein